MHIVLSDLISFYFENEIIFITQNFVVSMFLEIADSYIIYLILLE